MCFRLLNAPIKTGVGVVTMTAPSVPPRTMMAPVIWATSLILPPSRIKPPRIPPKATITPANELRSNDTFCPLFAMEGLRFGPIGPIHRKLTRNSSSVAHNPRDDFLRTFAHHVVVAAGEGDHRVRRSLNVLD